MAPAKFPTGPSVQFSTPPALTGASQVSQVHAMIDLPYSLVIEATDDLTFFGFFSPDLEGFSGVGHSVEDCLYQALGHARACRITA